MDWVLIIQGAAALGAGGLLGTIARTWFSRDKDHAEASKIWSEVYGDTIADLRGELTKTKDELRDAAKSAREAAGAAQLATRAAQQATDDLEFVISLLGPMLEELAAFGRDVSRERAMLEARGIELRTRE